MPPNLSFVYDHFLVLTNLANITVYTRPNLLENRSVGNSEVFFLKVFYRSFTNYRFAFLKKSFILFFIKVINYILLYIFYTCQEKNCKKIIFHIPLKILLMKSQLWKEEYFLIHLMILLLIW